MTAADPLCPDCGHEWLNHYVNDGCYGGAETNQLCPCPRGVSRWDGMPAEGNLGVVEVLCTEQHGLTAGGLVPCRACRADAV